jgi:RNA polymerase sigma-70 factor (ECF subfamily)
LEGRRVLLGNMATIAADQLLAEHGPALRNFLGARCRDADLVADLMQELAARLVTAAPRLYAGGNGNLRGYLFRIAASVWHDHLRRELVRRRGAHLMPNDRTAPPADALLLEGELHEAVRRALAALPAPQREVVTLRHERGLTFQQIADRLGRPLGTVLTQMRAGLTKIATALEDYR